MEYRSLKIFLHLCSPQHQTRRQLNWIGRGHGYRSRVKSPGAFLCYTSASIGKKYLPKYSYLIGILLNSGGLGA